MIRYSVERKPHRETVRRAIVDAKNNVYIYGSRGSGKTFFQRTQAAYFSALEADIVPIYIPCDARWGSPGDSSAAFALHVLSALSLELWQRAFRRSKSDLIRLSTTGDRSILDDLRTEQRRFVDLYRLVTAKQFESKANSSSTFGAIAVAKAEIKREETQSTTRGFLLPSEVFALSEDLAAIIASINIKRIVVLLDEVEMIGYTQGLNFYSTCLELFNPVGVQFVVTGTPSYSGDHDFMLSSFETSLELEGFTDFDDFLAMIEKYSGGVPSISLEAIEVLFEFFKGHPRMSLSCCARAVELASSDGGVVTPRTMAKVCITKLSDLQESIKHYERNFGSRLPAGTYPRWLSTEKD